MKTLNFNFVLDHGFGIEIESGGTKWDLHNCADFIGFTANVLDATVTLSWIYKQAERLDMLLTAVDFFEVLPRDPEMPLDEDMTLSELSFMSVEDDSREYRRERLIPGSYTPDGHLYVIFRGGQTIRIGAEEVSLRCSAVDR